jgi:excisionase family DNA binding protein
VDGIQGLIAETVRNAVREAVRDLQGEATGVQREEVPPRAGPEYVSVKEAGRIMSAHPSTVRKLVAAGKLGRYSVEGQPRVRVAELHTYLARETRHGAPVDLDQRALEVLRGGLPDQER